MDWMTPRGPNLLREFRILRIVFVFWFVFGIQVVQVAKELVETVIGGQMFVEITQMILAELAGHIAHWLEQFRQWSDPFHAYSFFCARQANLQQVLFEKGLWPVMNVQIFRQYNCSGRNRR